MRRSALFLATWFFSALVLTAWGDVPNLINFQGLLRDTNGDPVTDGPYFVTFRIFSVPAGGTALWADTQTVTTSDGLFNVVLGSNLPVPDSVFNGIPRYVGVTVFPDGEMTPRQELVTSPYAFKVGQIGAQIDDYVPKWDGFALVSGTIYDNGNVGIGVALPSEKLTVAGTVYSTAGGFKFPDGSVQSTAVSPSISSVAYTRWGRTTCPVGATLVYQGVVGGANYSHAGGGANLLCLSTSPTWDEFNGTNQNGALMYGLEYQTSGYGIASFAALNNFEAPCAVCLRDMSTVTVMQPGTQTCPGGWNLEYAGYLMATHYTQSKSEFVCVDRQAEAIGSNAASAGSFWYPTEAECGSLPCGPYVQDREITCSVCSK